MSVPRYSFSLIAAIACAVLSSQFATVVHADELVLNTTQISSGKDATSISIDGDFVGWIEENVVLVQHLPTQEVLILDKELQSGLENPKNVAVVAQEEGFIAYWQKQIPLNGAAYCGSGCVSRILTCTVTASNPVCNPEFALDGPNTSNNETVQDAEATTLIYSLKRAGHCPQCVATVYAKDMETGVVLTGGNAGNSPESNLSNDRVVYASCGAASCPEGLAINVWNLQTDSTINLNTVDGQQRANPDISQNQVVWSESDYTVSPIGSDIYTQVLGEEAEIITAPTGDGSHDSQPTIEGEHIVVRHQETGSLSRLDLYRTSTAEKFDVLDPLYLSDHDVSGNRIAWVGSDTETGTKYVYVTEFDFEDGSGGNQSPVAIFKCGIVSTNPRTDLTFYCDGSNSYDPDGDALTYSWDFGDGTTKQGHRAIHNYPTGNYYTTLTVRDVHGATHMATVMAMHRGKLNVSSLHAVATGVDHNHEWKDVEIADAGFESLPIVVTAMSSTNGGDTAGVRIKDVTDQSFVDKIEEEQSKDKELKHNKESLSVLAVEEGLIHDAEGEIVGEAGSVDATHVWTTVVLSKPYANPVVLAQASTLNGAAPSHVRIRNVGPQSFQVKIEEWMYLDQKHPLEAVGYIVLEQGSHELLKPDPAWLAGKAPSFPKLLKSRIDVSTVQVKHQWKAVNYPVDAETGLPIQGTVLTQCQTTNGSQPVVTRQRPSKKSLSKFDIRLQEEEAQGSHNLETVAVVVIK